MSGKTILIVGGVAIGAYFIVKAFATTTTTQAKAPASSTLLSQQQGVFLGSLLGGSIGSIFQYSANSTKNSNAPGVVQTNNQGDPQPTPVTYTDFAV